MTHKTLAKKLQKFFHNLISDKLNQMTSNNSIKKAELQNNLCAKCKLDFIIIASNVLFLRKIKQKIKQINNLNCLHAFIKEKSLHILIDNYMFQYFSMLLMLLSVHQVSLIFGQQTNYTNVPCKSDDECYYCCQAYYCSQTDCTESNFSAIILVVIPCVILTIGFVGLGLIYQYNQKRLKKLRELRSREIQLRNGLNVQGSPRHFDPRNGGNVYYANMDTQMKDQSLMLPPIEIMDAQIPNEFNESNSKFYLPNQMHDDPIKPN